jgi:hypothetical protein
MAGRPQNCFNGLKLYSINPPANDFRHVSSSRAMENTGKSNTGIKKPILFTLSSSGFAVFSSFAFY